jgi:hypothetical protein
VKETKSHEREEKKIISQSTTRGKEKNTQFNHGLGWEVEIRESSIVMYLLAVIMNIRKTFKLQVRYMISI